MVRVVVVLAAICLACTGELDSPDAAGNTGSVSSLRSCIDADAGWCSFGCEQGETCFTDLACGPTMDAGIICFWPSAQRTGDDRCHRSCDESVDCAPDEVCAQRFFYGCGDYNGSPNAPRGVCCAPDAGC